jgi:hypothetical protein
VARSAQAIATEALHRLPLDSAESAVAALLEAIRRAGYIAEDPGRLEHGPGPRRNGR